MVSEDVAMNRKILCIEYTYIHIKRFIKNIHEIYDDGNLL